MVRGTERFLLEGLSIWWRWRLVSGEREELIEIAKTVVSVTWSQLHAPVVCLVLVANSKLRPGTLLVPRSSPDNANSRYVDRYGWKSHLAALSTPEARFVFTVTCMGR